MRRLSALSVVLVLAVSPLIAGCGSSPPAGEDQTQSKYRRPDIKYYQYDLETRMVPPEAADYLELTDSAARVLFEDCRKITGLGYSGTDRPVNLVSTFDAVEYCNVYTISDGWLSIMVRTFDAQVIQMKNDRAIEADYFAAGLDERGARELGDAILAGVAQAEDKARVNSPGLSQPEHIEYTEPATNGFGIGPNTGSWYIRWDRVANEGIPYYLGGFSENDSRQGKSVSLRVDGLFVEARIYEALGCSDTVSRISSERAVECAKTIMETNLGNPRWTTTTDLVYLVPDPTAVARESNPTTFSWPAPCSPKENRLAWVVRVSNDLGLPPGTMNHLSHAEVWVDALTGEVVGVEGW